MKVFETHMHDLMKQPLENSVKIFKEVFELTSIEKGLFLGIPMHKYVDGIDYTENLKVLFLKNYFKPNFYAFAGLIHNQNFTTEESSKSFYNQAKLYNLVGFDGIKMLEGKPLMRREIKIKLSAKTYDKFYSFMEEAQMPITLHNADPSEFWDKSKLSQYAIEHNWACGENDLTKLEMLNDVLDVMKKHPKLHLTLAHFGFMGDNLKIAEKFLGDYEYTAFDMTPACEEYFHMKADWDNWYKFFDRFQDRIKYGSDMYNFIKEDQKQWEMVSTVRPNFIKNWCETDCKQFFYDTEYCGVKLPKKWIEKFYMENATNEYGNPKKIDMNYVQREIEQLKILYKDDVFKTNDLLFMEKEFYK